MSSLMYTSTNKIKFTSISDKYKVERCYKGKLSQLHAALITYVSEHYQNTNKYRKQVTEALNIITYAVYANEPLPFSWSPNAPLDNIPELELKMIEDTLGELFLTPEGIEWDIKESEYADSFPLDTENNSVKSNKLASNSVKDNSNSVKVEPKPESTTFRNIDAAASRPSKANKIEDKNTFIETPKQDLYIQPPKFPQFDYTKPWISEQNGYDNLVIYTTLPEIPTKQSEISVTTDVTKMTRAEKLRLYPNNLIKTRASVMYEPVSGIKLHPQFGLILPIEGYTEDQLIDNLIQYPHIFRLSREIDGEMYSFYSHIEINGELKGTLDVWNDLPESSVIPRQTEFVKEYVVRRYLLERDIKKIDHKYKLFGNLDPFLTLFMPSDMYIKNGYTDIEKIATQCVVSRVLYKQSRNPILRRLGN